MLKGIIESIADEFDFEECERPCHTHWKNRNLAGCIKCAQEYYAAKLLTAVRECKKPRPKNDAGYNEVCETVAHNAAIDKVLAKLEGK